ncbi:MAG: glycosyltransferase family 2 protein [Phycisphaerales bacterium]
MNNLANGTVNLGEGVRVLPDGGEELLAIIILNYRTPQLVINCLRSLEGQVQASSQQVIIVDNSSGDESVDLICAAIKECGWSEWANLIVSPDNEGFAAGNNVGIKEVDADFYILFNSDTIIRDRAVEQMVAYMREHPRVGILGSRLEDPDGTPQCSAFRFHTWQSCFENAASIGVVSRFFRRKLVAKPIPTRPERVDWVCGASMLIRRDVIDQVGMLDQGYFMYFEETDFCLNAKRAGFECWYDPAPRVVHLVGQASGVRARESGRARRRPRYWFDSKRRYFLKNHGKFYLVLVDLSTMLGLLLHILWCGACRKQSSRPERFLRDTISNSFFRRGFGLGGDQLS